MKTVLNALLFCLIMLPATLLGQSTAKGIVTDKANAMPMPGVNVIIKGTSRGTITDFDGKYSLELSQGEILVFSYVGYTTQEIEFTGQASIDVVIEEDSALLDEVILIGYGSVQKEDVTGAVDLLKAEDFNQGPLVSAQQLISGKIAGVSVTSGSGAPGDGQNILIRGNGSLSLSSNPLIVLDGIPLSNDGVGGSRNPLNVINPNDIESMTVLKDASATAIYGSRAANGVIIITSKRGKDTDFRFNGSSSTTIHTAIDRVDVLNANQFREIVTTHPNSDATTIGLLGNSNTNWQDEIYQTAFGQDHSFSALGSAYGVPIRASLSHSDHDGTLIGDNFQRTTASINLSPKLFDDHLKLDISARGNYTENTFANRDAIGSANTFDPTQAIYDSNSLYGGYFAWSDPANGGAQPLLAGTNPLALLNLKDDSSEVRRYILNLKADYKLHFFPDITATVSTGIDESSSNGRTLVSELMPTSDPIWNGSRSTYSNTSSNKLFDAYLTYKKSLNEIHNITAVAGYSYQSFESDDFSYDSEAEEIGTDFEFINKQKAVLLSYFGRFNYDYDGKYLLTATLRADASSKLNPDDRWGYFPSVAFAWNITNEDFLDSKNINNLKLRLGYGQVGNTNGLDNYKFLTRYTGSQSSANYQFGNSFYQTYRPEPFNKDLRWEVGNTFNIGLDYSLFNQRVFGAVNVYKKQTKDLIAFASVDPLTNFGSAIEQNIGDMENKGIEFELNLVPVRTEDWEWSIGYNIAFNDNEITKLPFEESVGGISGGNGNNVQIQREGEAPYSYYVFQQVYDTSGNPIEGAFVDRNGDNVINDEDKYIYKDPYADIIMGLNTNVSFKKWDLAVVTRANIGNYAYNDVSASNSYLDGVVPSTNNYLSNIHSSYLENGFVSQSNENTFLSSHYIEEASFFKIDNITLGYTLDNAIKDVSLRIYGSVQNVATITDYEGLDPEITGGIDSNFYPRPRSFVFGVNVDF